MNEKKKNEQTTIEIDFRRPMIYADCIQRARWLRVHYGVHYG